MHVYIHTIQRRKIVSYLLNIDVMPDIQKYCLF